jgi:hypothetical protein
MAKPCGAKGSGENLRCESVEMVFVDQAAPGGPEKGTVGNEKEPRHCGT